MTSRVKGYPFEVVVSADEPSIVLADQVKSLDWRARKAKKKGVVDESVLAEVVGKLGALIF
jgi:mRNA interferase MazF